MIKTNTTISKLFMESLINAYGSQKNFERELVYKAYQYGNKGRLYFGINSFLNFQVFTEDSLEKSLIPLLICNLDICDISNFIEDIDYCKLSNAYLHVRNSIQS